MNERERIDPDRAVEMVSEVVNKVVKNCDVSVRYEYTEMVTDYVIVCTLSYGRYRGMFRISEYQLRFDVWREFVAVHARQLAVNLGRTMFLQGDG